MSEEITPYTANSPPNPERWWRHRRRHSYLSLLGLFTLMGSAIIIPNDSLNAASPLLQTIAWIFGLIILSYILAATAEDISKIKR